MVAKMGRPLKDDEPMTKTVLVRMTEMMHDRLEGYAEEHGLKKTDVARLAIEKLLEK